MQDLSSLLLLNIKTFHRIRMEDDLGVRVANGKTYDNFAISRAARFSLYPDPKTSSVNTKDVVIKSSRGSYMDLLMAEIPGKFVLTV